MVRKYRKSYLQDVIVRLDYSYPLTKLTKSLPQKIRDRVSTSFPISEPKEFIGKELKITKDATKEQVIEGTNWLFHSIDRQKTLMVARDNINVSYKRYDTFDILKQDFIPIVTEIFNIYDDLQSKRLGLRYINEITLSENNVLDWSSYLSDSLLTNLGFVKEVKQISKVFTNLELNKGDYNIRFQYGMFNPDYPAPIQRKSFILDYDAYHQGALELGEIAPKLDGLHIAIKDIFEKSIKDGLRSLMGDENNE